MKTVVLLMTLSLALFSLTMPERTFKVSGGVTDMVLVDEKLYVGTDASSVDILDLDKKTVVKKIVLEKIEDFMGDEIHSKVYSIDVLGNLVLILSQDQKGYRRIHLYDGSTLQLLLDFHDRLYIAKAKFLDDKRIVFALLSNELISYDLKQKQENWHLQVASSKFSDFVLDETKQVAVIADESGNLKLHGTKDGVFIQSLRDQNLDNVFQVDMKNGMIATAGQDRKVVLYDRTSKNVSSITSDFLVYSVGLSPSGNIVGYSCDEQNNVAVFQTNPLQSLAKFGGNKMTLSKILFKNEREFFVSSDSNEINYYKLK